MTFKGISEFFLGIVEPLNFVNSDMPMNYKPDTPLDHDAKDRLTRLEEQRQSDRHLIKQMADNADKTAEALQELVLIHKETTIRSENDRRNVSRLYTRVENVEVEFEKMRKILWRCIYVGTGSGVILSLLWYAGLLSTLISVYD